VVVRPENAFQPSTFDMQGIVPIGYAVFATALGIAAGALLRRTLSAIAITLGGFIGLRLLIANAVRPHYLGTVTAYFSPKLSTFTPPASAWVVSQGLVGKTGSSGVRGFATYQPASHYWPFQGIETGIYVALALVLLAVTYVVVTRRDA
jgi:hypothetical protein